MNNTMRELLAGHRFCSRMKPEYIGTIASCSITKSYKPNEMLGREGELSDYFFLIMDGRVAIESSQPGLPPVVLQTLHGGEVVGWSWLFPPYEWVFDARALTDVETIALDAQCLKEKCEEDNALGFDLMKRFSQVMTTRLKAARLQLLDLYGRQSSNLTA
ncbi:MAG: cyclic nucleotide-binding domain-containing protein [Oligoflexales bacterium]